MSWKFTYGDYFCTYVDTGNNFGKIDNDDFDNSGDDDDDDVEGFDKHPLVLAENPRTHQFYVPLDSPKVESSS